jgi:hypothetical protein
MPLCSDITQIRTGPGRFWSRRKAPMTLDLRSALLVTPVMPMRSCLTFFQTHSIRIRVSHLGWNTRSGRNLRRGGGGISVCAAEHNSRFLPAWPYRQSADCTCPRSRAPWRSTVARVSTMGPAQLIVIGGPAERLTLARTWGATHVIDITETPDPAERLHIVREQTHGRGADVVLEMPGAISAFAE